MSDLTTIGAAYRTEADRAGLRALAFAVLLVLAHMLDVRPSEFETFGFKVGVNDPVIVYGAIALVFGYYASRFMSLSETSLSLLPLAVAPRRLRSNLRQARQLHRQEKSARKKPQSPQALKKAARSLIRWSDFFLFPYRLLAGLFIVLALVFMAMDLYGLVSLIWRQSPVVSQVTSFLSDL